MGYNFKSVDRETAYLLPPNMREWLPAKHLAWFIVDTVESLDLKKFYSAYRSDGWGRAAYEPKMMTARSCQSAGCNLNGAWTHPDQA